MELNPTVRRFIERQRVARLATVDAEGAPHLVPICFALVGDVLYSVIDEKPQQTTRLQRLLNIEAEPRVTVLFDEYHEDWTRLAWVMLRGDAAVCADSGEFWEGLAALTARYPQYRNMNIDGRPMIRVRCEAVTQWGQLEERSDAGGEALGLHLVRTVERISPAHVTTEHRAGLSSGGLSRLRANGDGALEEPVESHDEAAMPDEGGRMLRYLLAELDDGLYVAESMGAGTTLSHTYFEVVGGRVARLFDDRRRALRELRRSS
jgi:PPOX class probable F420-dependent enzyme